MYHGGGRALGLKELSSFWLATHRTGPATMGTSLHFVRGTCLTLTPPLRSPLSLISSFTHSLLNLFSSARVSFCILLHVWWTMKPSFPNLSLFLLEEVSLMKPSWRQIIGWGGTVTTQNRSTQHQSNPHPWIVIDLRNINNYMNKSTLLTLPASQVLPISHSLPPP